MNLLTTAELKAMGKRPRTGEVPAATEEWRYGRRSGARYLWRLDQAADIQDKTPVPKTVEQSPSNVLHAIWSVNRAAKRRRDAASATYGQSLHGFAGHNRREKERYYGLKDRGIAWLAHHGHINALHVHGRLVVWGAAGYRFHSTLLPREGALEPVDVGRPVLIEARPPGRAEMRLVDATHLLERLPSLVSNHNRVAMPFVRRRDDDEEEEEDYDEPL